MGKNNRKECKKDRIKKRQEAYKLYMEDISTNEVANRVGVTRQTVSRWLNNGKWRERREELREQVLQDIDATVLKEKERSLKLIRGAEAIIAQKIQSGEIEGITISSLAQLQKAKWEILMPRATSQYNFMKKETNVNMNFPELLRSIRNGEGI